jgi:methylmalonyl-CoA mutase
VSAESKKPAQKEAGTTSEQRGGAGERLFQEFPPPTVADWRAEAEKQLRGAAFEERLLTRMPEGLTLQPLHVRADVEDLPFLDAPPGFAPYVRGRRALARGAEAWLIDQDIDEGQAHTADGGGAADPLGDLASRGELPLPLASAYDEMAATARQAAERGGPDGGVVETIRASSEPYHEGGGHAVQELGFALATAVEYVRELERRGVSPETTAAHLGFGFAIGTRFFTEVAKLRAARLLWDRVLEACGVPAEARATRIQARTSRATKTKIDPHVNLLRGTTEAFSAVIGGADSVRVDPFDRELRRPDDFSRRLARNTQLILRDEAHLGEVMDPGGGSWTIERLTADLAAAAWELFQRVERDGGMAAALQAGWPQREIAETAAARERALATRRQVLVGTNRYPNPHEKPLAATAGQGRDAGRGDDDKDARSAARMSGGDTHAPSDLPRVEPIPLRRAAEPFEKLRAAVEKQRRDAGNLAVYLATLGPAARIMPRLDFAASFFEVGGFAVTRGEGHDTAAAAAGAAVASGADVIVICGPDEAYAKGAPIVAAQVKSARPDALVILAGRPAEESERERLNEAGVDLFIHARTDVLETLGHVAARLGVRT